MPASFPLPSPLPCNNTQVYDHNSSGKNELIGEVRITLAQLRQMAPGPYVAPAAGLPPAIHATGAAAAATPPAAPAASRTLDMVAPPGAKSAGSKVCTVTVRQVMVRPGASAGQALAGLLSGCF